LPEAQVMEAEILGRAMRFGAMFTVARPTDHGALTWRPKRKELILTLKTDEGRALFGEVTEARFRALAGAMGAEAKVEGALKAHPVGNAVMRCISRRTGFRSAFRR
jgi:exopolyphosphatase/guanosine-5'-triphosphate,3'-diphosphate pyrophosphatase